MKRGNKTLFSITLQLFLAALFCGGRAVAQTMVPDSHAGHEHAEGFATHEQAPVLLGAYSELPTDHAIGEVSAQTTMIIYASVTCPHCSHWFGSVWPSLKKSHVETGKLRVVFREFPTAPAGLAFAGFLIANCGPEQDYFANIEHQMAEQERLMKAAQSGMGEVAYLAVAQKAGLADKAEMDECFADQTQVDKIVLSQRLAQSANIKSVPSFIIAGQIYNGDTGYLGLARHLEDLSATQSSFIPK